MLSRVNPTRTRPSWALKIEIYCITRKQLGVLCQASYAPKRVYNYVYIPVHIVCSDGCLSADFPQEQSRSSSRNKESQDVTMTTVSNYRSNDTCVQLDGKLGPELGCNRLTSPIDLTRKL